MKEFKVGERITLEVVKVSPQRCYGCFFYDMDDCSNIRDELSCSDGLRTDHNNVIYRLVEPKK